jgi:hypothetical protein
MIGDDFQQTNSGEGTGYQAKKIVVNGLSITEAHQMALDLWKSNALVLSQLAAEVALGRVNEFLDAFLAKLNAVNPALFDALQQPGMQMALYNAQKEYARSGDKDQFALLIDVLVDRANEPERNVMQIVLDESLAVLPKLTQEHLDLLSLTMVFRGAFARPQERRGQFDRLMEIITRLCANLVERSRAITHMQYCSCVNLHGEMFSNNQPDWVRIIGFVAPYYPAVFEVPLDVKNGELFTKVAEKNRDFLITEWPPIKRLFDFYSDYRIDQFYLTSVGYALGLANLNRVSVALGNNKLELSRWIK